jgi:hypothetical protein
MQLRGLQLLSRRRRPQSFNETKGPEMSAKTTMTREQIEEFRRYPFISSALAARIDSLCDLALSALDAQWVSVNDRLPDEDGRLWIALAEKVTNGKVVGYYPIHEFYHFHEGWATDETIVYWLNIALPPLPAPPKGGNG